MRTDRSLRILLGAASIAFVTSALGGLAYLSRPVAPDGEPVLGTAQLLMLETDSCDLCEKFRRKAGRDYQTTELAGSAPLRFLNVEDGPPPKRYRLSYFSKSPTLVLFDKYGRELDRLSKLPLTADAVEVFVRRHMRTISRI